MTTDDTAAALARRATHSGHGCADVDAPQPVLDLADPELVRAFAEYNAGVERARDEYAEFPFLRSACGPSKQRRACARCGDYHKSKTRALCWRCIPPRTDI